jgi:hypothetical protein
MLTSRYPRHHEYDTSKARDLLGARGVAVRSLVHQRRSASG